MLIAVRRGLTNYVRALTHSPLQFGIGVMAFWFASNGPAAYLLYPAMFSDPAPFTAIVFGFVPVTINLCHMLRNLITGIVGMVAVCRYSWTRIYAVLGGTYYIVWGLVGLLGGDHVRHHLGVDIFGTWVHVIEGSILLALWARDRVYTRRTAVAA